MKPVMVAMRRLTIDEWMMLARTVRSGRTESSRARELSRAGAGRRFRPDLQNREIANGQPQGSRTAVYTDSLTVNKNADAAAVMNRLLAENFQSIGSADTKGKAQLIGQVQFFWKLIPDLKWDVQEMIQEGNKVVVRSIATGTPKGDFMGMPTDGSKSFKIMTIDIHTIEQNQIKQIHHLEDWTTALKQLKG